MTDSDDDFPLNLQSTTSYYRSRPPRSPEPGLGFKDCDGIDNDVCQDRNDEGFDSAHDYFVESGVSDSDYSDSVSTVNGEADDFAPARAVLTGTEANIPLSWGSVRIHRELDGEDDFGWDEDDAVPYTVHYVEDETDVSMAQNEVLFEQLNENEGFPPASKHVVDNLPEVIISEEDSKNNNGICAVCKDDINVGDKAKQLPCKHHYHGDCIIPWLGIRNTCPVCRRGLPTDKCLDMKW